MNKRLKPSETHRGPCIRTLRITGENWHDKRNRSTLMKRYETGTMEKDASLRCSGGNNR